MALTVQELDAYDMAPWIDVDGILLKVRGEVVVGHGSCHDATPAPTVGLNWTYEPHAQAARRHSMTRSERSGSDP